MKTRARAAGLAAGTILVVGAAAAPTFVDAGGPQTTVSTVAFTDQSSYDQLWDANFGPGSGSVTFGTDSVTVDDPVFSGTDFSVFDHLKYIRTSHDTYSVPQKGSLEFAVDITAHTTGTDPNRDIVGCYLPGQFDFWNGTDPCPNSFSQRVLEGQQAGVVLNMINFQTGQLFDWFVSEHQVFALIERLPSAVTNIGNVGLDKAYTQIIKVGDITPGQTHKVAIRYTRGTGQSFVEYFLDGKLFTRVDQVGVPLDKQHQPFTGYAPSLGQGEDLRDQLSSFTIGHGLFSLLDAFPYQHPDAPDLRVSIPAGNRAFGQGATGTWAHFTVTTVTK